MYTPDRYLDPPAEKKIEEVQRCDNCHEAETVYTLGITIYDLYPQDKVCLFCWNELNNNFHLKKLKNVKYKI